MENRNTYLIYKIIARNKEIKRVANIKFESGRISCNSIVFFEKKSIFFSCSIKRRKKQVQDNESSQR